MNANFHDIHAAADYIGPGAIEVPIYQTEITDIVRRRGLFGQRIKQVPATGHPSRYFEQTGIPEPTAANGFVDPRNISAPVVTPTRVERAVPLKALVAQINYNLFDVELGNQQSQFAYLQAKDLADTIEGVMHIHDLALWNGNDTSLSSPTTVQYFGAAGQIAASGNTTTITTTELIVDNLKSTIAQMVANSSYAVRPTAIYANPVLLDLVDREMKTEFNVVSGHEGNQWRIQGENVDHAGGRIAFDSGLVSELHGNAGFGKCAAAGLYRDRRSDRISLAERSESARVSTRRTGLTGFTICCCEVWSSCGQDGQRRRSLPSDRSAIEPSKLTGTMLVNTSLASTTGASTFL